MTMLAAENCGVEQLAERVISDIRSRGLAHGDRYFTTQEAGRRFGVTQAIMDRALHRLSMQDVLVRRRKAGTFVGPRAEVSADPSGLRRIYVLTSSVFAGTYLDADELIEALWNEFPGVSVEFVRLSGHDSAGHVRSLVEQAHASGQEIGFVAISADRMVYTVLAEAKVPTVILGCLEVEVPVQLTSIDSDYVAAGRLLVNYLLSQGRRRISVLMPEAWRHGDNLFFESIRQTMGEAGLPVTSLCVRSIPSDPAVYREEVHRLLSQEDRPAAVITRQGLLRRPNSSTAGVWAPMLVVEVARELGLGVPADLLVTYDLGRDLPTQPLPLPCTHRIEPWSETLASVAKHLQHLATKAGDPSEGPTLLPVRLYLPEDQASEEAP